MTANYGRQEVDPELLQKKLETILDLEEDLVVFLNKAGLITKVNANGALALEFKEEDLLNRHIIDLIASKNKVETMKAFNDIIDGKPERAFETSLNSYSGNEILFGINARPLYSDGKMSEIVLIGKDITRLREVTDEIENLKMKLIEANRIISIERQRANQRKSFLEELNKMKSDFVSNISHELRTPLASIIGFSETIDSDPDMPDAMRS
jgi:PAS domain S-box-containing protein